MYHVQRTRQFSDWLGALDDVKGRAAVLARLDRLAVTHGKVSGMTGKSNSRVARKLGIRRFDAAEYLRDETDVAAYLKAAAAEGDARILAAALGAVARARGMSAIARQTGMTREALYRSLSARGNPQLATLTRVLKAIGMRIAIQPIG